MIKQADNSESNLELEPGDETLSLDELKQIGLISNLKRPDAVGKCLSAVVLRRFSEGDVICRQGDEGSTAFYILGTKDVLNLRNYQQESGANVSGQKPAADVMSADIAAVNARQNEKSVQRRENDARIATAILLNNGAVTAKANGSGGILKKLFGGKKEIEAPESIPIDGPTDINYQTRTAPMFETDIFGEMSCINHTPRSATIVADSDCFMLEFLRVFLDELRKDANYCAKMDDEYRQRVLKNHLRRLDLLSDLGEEELNLIRDSADLVRVEPGSIIFDEGDPADSVLLVRSGLVQVIADLNLVFTEDDVTDWQQLCQELAQGEQ